MRKPLKDDGVFRVNSPVFRDGGRIPTKHTSLGENRSPELCLKNISLEAKSIAILMDDIDHPIFPNYNHWIIWNIPVCNGIPEGIPAGETVASLGGARQGIGYGTHRYKGPKPPLRMRHRYRFCVYLLDAMLELPAKTRKRGLLRAMEGHILQKGTLTGVFQRGWEKDQ